ncbi:hypothetical protein Pmar_PMAR024020 [Perkinsus marinus ATCC 50983]|uniref:Uncharacterized protein n=1 Tax=Perkinsus marinus (strain ATCC 50983 / TXsc) TaxID=423536 RepID=C5L6F5_PERM5|nr:hypothetical protein Pmar_PMAR024020 [Perkinsus marinus ATCC 50983]EER07616.1 hypothetical protein Pmar_PMAR024020 [Perkinsus marinus ATCC 50983]|eukprot:XP_002775800.1 hypothetical protein Pmar_PMAR024020 [Perkinsus marinus ATCC 50983]
MHLRGKKHLSKSRWYKTSTLLHHNGQGVGGGDGQVSATTAPAAAATANDDAIGMVIFEDHTIWQETNTGWLYATVNSDSMAMAHMSSRKHQSNMAWASNTTALPSVDGGGMNNQWYAAGYNEGVEFQNGCTYQFYGNRDMPISFGHVDNTGPMGHAPAHNNWEDSRCKLCQTGDICGWAAWSGHFNGKAHKKNVRMNKYEYVAVWQKLSAEGFEYYYDHLTGLWDSHNPVEDEIGYFPDDGIIYVRDPSSFEE